MYLLYGFLILLIVGTGLLFVQNEFEKAQKTKEETAYYPELRDQYNGYGLTDHKTLSTTKLSEREDQVIYADRIFNINRINMTQTAYAGKIAEALSKKTGIKVCLMPIPGRSVLEEGYENEKEQYQAFLNGIEETIPDSVQIVNPLPELEEHSDEFIFFRTEDNWTMRGAFYGAQTYFTSIGFEKENLDAYREYVFGTFGGGLWTVAVRQYETEAIFEGINAMEKDPFYIYINGSNPNREEVTFENRNGETQTIKKTTIQFTGSGCTAVIAEDFEHSIVEGRGEENLLLITDDKGKMMISYLSERFGKVYVSNVYEDNDFARNLEAIIDTYDIKYVIWAQSASEMGSSSYMRALNALAE